MNEGAAASAVDFVVNCYERTYRHVLEPGFVSSLAASQQYAFSQITVLVNNVEDPDDAHIRASTLIAAEPRIRVVWVDQNLAGALASTGLRRRDIKRLPHFSDCCLVAVTLSGPAWVCYWDADARLREAMDWISPVRREMERDPRHLVGNPNNWHVGLAEREAVRKDERAGLAIGYGFSDVAFLARREDFSARMYRSVAPASWRYPLSAVEPIFEQRVDAWMRRCRRTRVTYLPAVIDHVGTEGSGYPSRTDLRTRVRRAFYRRGSKIAAALSSHPAFRAYL